ncbi:hypothetical protein GWI33_008623 [Rhynchophorus ferrugineus]|uniref:Major facilitator superfamily (MFS) profile domain-containing protein n=1 Tax=Rhynchophorus ferrugineus TaxID=354439 RepID=A0A834IBQ8_RHYFE|nr:hypothetical protein GWI33_008623 [Rhynchophorus ferrugineus]
MVAISSINIVYIISFIDLFAVGLTFPLFSTHLKSLGASHTFIGILMSIYSALQVISGPLIGSWTDFRGRSFVLKSILLICAICYGLLGLTTSYVIIVCLRIVLGCTKHIQSICKAMITDLLPHDKHSAAFGKSAAVSSIGFIIGPLIGGHISELQNGFFYVSLLTGILFIFNLVVVFYFGLDDKKNNQLRRHIQDINILQQMKHDFIKSVSDLKKVGWHRQWEPFTLRLLFGLSTSTYFSNQSLLLKERYNLSQKHIGYIMSYFSIVGSCSAYFLNQINKLLGTRNSGTRLLIFFGLLSLCVVAIYVSSNFYVYLYVLIPFSMSCSVLRIVSMEVILDSTDADHRGSLSGASNSMMSISRFLTPLVTGILGDFFGEESVILVAIIPALFGVVLSLHLRKSIPLHVDDQKVHSSE